MKIKVNGEKQTLQEQMNLYDFLNLQLNGEDTKGIAIALNFNIIPRQKWETTFINEDDEIEIVHAVQGG
ncbi:MAG: sulfur carrier protein ThiS [Ignavibacteria bacterium]|jgi:thiamine biosynthesis protein ThiS